jgi:hypothetical protein
MSALPPKADIVHGGGMSALGQNQTCPFEVAMSAIPRKRTLAHTIYEYTQLKLSVRSSVARPPTNPMGRRAAGAEPAGVGHGEAF